ncbi:MAG: hypothetical protein F6K41_19285 [Symploca sp. SIO3E6]|nr:hypothetical protein [Caldora sp. SIO3E6]
MQTLDTGLAKKRVPPHRAEDNATEVILIAWYGYIDESEDREFQGTYKVYTVQLEQA